MAAALAIDRPALRYFVLCLSRRKRSSYNDSMGKRETIDYALWLVREGVLRIDEEGQIWRHAEFNHGQWRLVEPRRAENVGGKGYLRLTLQVPNLGRLGCVGAHKVVWELSNGPIPDGLQINHKDLNKSNNRPDNLELVDQSGNMRHSYASGKRPHPWAFATHWRGKPRISVEQRDEIRALRASGALLREIGERFGLSLSHVSALCKEEGG